MCHSWYTDFSTSLCFQFYASEDGLLDIGKGPNDTRDGSCSVMQFGGLLISPKLRWRLALILDNMGLIALFVS
jgi:hypothetical protein